jgi:hypothetical protein
MGIQIFWNIMNFLMPAVRQFHQLAFSQKRSQCILGSFGGTTYGDRGRVCERVEVSTIKYQLFRRQKWNISFLHYTLNLNVCCHISCPSNKSQDFGKWLIVVLICCRTMSVTGRLFSGLYCDHRDFDSVNLPLETQGSQRAATWMNLLYRSLPFPCEVYTFRQADSMLYIIRTFSSGKLSFKLTIAAENSAYLLVICKRKENFNNV